MKGGYAGCSNPEAPRDTLLCRTTLSGDIGTPDVATDNCFHVVTGSNTGTGTVLNGFIITDGCAGGFQKGSGLTCTEGNLTLLNCTFSGKQYSLKGGAIYLSESHVEMTNCWINNNSSLNGGGIFSHESLIKIRNCTFYGNTATEDGGGFRSIGGTHYFWQCIFYGNSARAGGGLYVGGWLKFRNGLIYKNTASNKGGGICIDSNASVLLICNSILWDDTATVSDNEICVQNGTLTVSYCDVKGGWP